MIEELKHPKNDHKSTKSPALHSPPPPNIAYNSLPPTLLPNYTLSTICPACEAETTRRACKVLCERCGFMWDCSEV